MKTITFYTGAVKKNEDGEYERITYTAEVIEEHDGYYTVVDEDGTEFFVDDSRLVNK